MKADQKFTLILL